jgi:integrase
MASKQDLAEQLLRRADTDAAGARAMLPIDEVADVLVCFHSQQAVEKALWIKARESAAESITLHEARHTCASILIAAGVNAKALGVIMGHSTIAMTFDTYGHLMPGGLDEAAADAYLSRGPALKLVA